MFRLARWWPSLHVWLRMVSTSVRALREPTILLLVLTFFFSVVGMQLFGTDYKDHVCRISMDCQLPRWHMNDFFHAFLVVFRALTGESVETLWDCMQVSGQPLCLIFFMVLLVLGNLLMLNLFLVLLLSPLSSYCLTEEKKKISMQISINRIQRAVRTLLGKKTQMDPDHKAVSSDQENRKELLAMTAVTSEQPESEVTALSSDQNSDSCWVSAASDVKVPEREKDKEKKKHDEDDEGHIPEDCCNDKCYRCCPFLDKDMSRGGGRVWSNFRRTCCSLVQHRGFDAFIIVIIVASSTALAFEDVHLQQHTVLKTVLETADQVFTFILLMEVILKIIAFGLKKYFTDAWCWLDFLVLHVRTNTPKNRTNTLKH
ncbi:sodium channel protein type 4 subunit alpha B-like [Plectropomus leopardus]|uniref:sodium channel protein type 4 subunit alpha B-like n=1 Tax=Plectropomus leopardus TaxID=160734 RepID=UPI001C4CC439|nr:sodium channel protein type 4 subunit alpha B-like [Plectropomus leopardus]